MQHDDLLVTALPQCPNCLSRDLVTSEESEEVSHGSGSSLVKVNVLIPVYRCNCCGMGFTDQNAENIKHDALCREMDVMTPREVRAARGNLTQHEFAIITRLGRASIARWESGSIIQSCSNDSYLYLMSFPDNLDRLSERANFVKSPAIESFGRFRKITPSQQEKLRAESETFELFI
jgi:DNA-binding transcriptional regulator YiaG